VRAGGRGVLLPFSWTWNRWKRIESVVQFSGFRSRWFTEVMEVGGG
jgi:hypothetical protein